MVVKRGLGRGLDALFENFNDDATGDSNGFSGARIQEIRIVDIDPNPFQPRKSFDEDKISELAESIKTHGLVQPIIVKPVGRRYLLVAGERRWRASKQAGLTAIPSVVMEMDERQVMEISLIENLQREDLNAVEEAKGIRLLSEEFGLTQEEISHRLGKSRSAVANTLRLLNLSEGIQQLLTEDKLTPGHARALLSIEDLSLREDLAKIIIDKGLNVRDTEKLIKENQGANANRKAEIITIKPAYIKDIEASLEEALGTRVEITPGRKKGSILIEYYSNEDLERIIERVNHK